MDSDFIAKKMDRPIKEDGVSPPPLILRKHLYFQFSTQLTTKYISKILDKSPIAYK